ncbi:MAG: hypothetical protein ACI9R3_004991 [Verrucomicrobiales bacterium]
MDLASIDRVSSVLIVACEYYFESQEVLRFREKASPPKLREAGGEAGILDGFNFPSGVIQTLLVNGSAELVAGVEAAD